MIRLQEIIIKKLSDELSRKRDAVNNELIRLQWEARRDSDCIFAGIATDDQKKNCNDIYNRMVENSELLNSITDDENSAFIQSTLAEEFAEEVAEYYIECLKALSGVDNEIVDAVVKIDEDEHQRKIVIREKWNEEFLSSTNPLMSDGFSLSSNASKLVRELYNNTGAKELIADEYKKRRENTGEYVRYRAVEMRTGGDIEDDNSLVQIWYPDGSSKCIHYGTEEFQNFDKLPEISYSMNENSDKEWYVGSNFVGAYQYDPECRDSSMEIEYIPVNDKELACHVFTYDQPEEVMNFEQAWLSVFYMHQEKITEGEIFRIAEEGTRYCSEVYRYNTEIYKHFDLDMDNIRGTAFCKMMFVSEEFEVLLVWGNVETGEIRAGYIKVG